MKSKIVIEYSRNKDGILKTEGSYDTNEAVVDVLTVLQTAFNDLSGLAISVAHKECVKEENVENYLHKVKIGELYN